MTPQEIEFTRLWTAELVKKYVPEEEAVFDEISTEFFEDPSVFHHPQGPSDAALGFGVGDVIQLVTPGLISMVSFIILQISQKFGEEFVKGTLSGAGNKFGEKTIGIFFEKLEANKSEINTDQIKNKIIEEAAQYGLSGKKCIELANKIMQQMHSKGHE